MKIPMSRRGNLGLVKAPGQDPIWCMEEVADGGSAFIAPGVDALELFIALARHVRYIQLAYVVIDDTPPAPEQGLINVYAMGGGNGAPQSVLVNIGSDAEAGAMDLVVSLAEELYEASLEREEERVLTITRALKEHRLDLTSAFRLNNGQAFGPAEDGLNRWYRHNDVAWASVNNRAVAEMMIACRGCSTRLVAEL